MQWDRQSLTNRIGKNYNSVHFNPLTSDTVGYWYWYIFTCKDDPLS